MGTNRNKGNNKRQPSPTASRDTKASEKGQQSKKDIQRSEESSDVELQNILSNRQQRKQKQVPQTEKQQAENSAALEMEIVKDTFSSSTSTNVPPVSTPHSSTPQQKVPAFAKKNTRPVTQVHPVNINITKMINRLKWSLISKMINPLSQDLQIIMQAQTKTPMRMKIPKIF